jgi:glycosyltransferase involved in cell wall biosynthesis
VRPSLVLALARLFHGVRASAVHTHDTRALIYGAPAARLARVKRLIHTQHGQNLGMTPRRLRLMRYCSRLTDSFVCVSQDAKRVLLEQGIPESLLRVVYNGIDVEQMQLHANDFRSIFEKSMLVAVARLSPEKDMANLVRAVGEIGDSIPELQVEIAGDGPCLGELQQLAQELGVSHRIRFLGRVAEPGDVFRRARLFVLPSLSEGVSLTLLEAMAAGVPVIATNVGGTSEVIQHERTGILVPPGGPKKLAEAIQNVWHDIDRLTQLSDAAQEHVTKFFHVRRMVEEYQRLYAGLPAVSSHLEALGDDAQHSSIA